MLSVVATPLPQASGSICLPGLPAPHSAVLGFPRLMPALAARPSQQRPVTQQLPKALVSGGSEVECCSAGGLNPEPWGGGPYMTPPCPPSTRLKAQSSQIGLPLFMCQMAPAACPIPSQEPELLLPSPTVSICPSYVPLCAVTDPAELPLILCSNNGAPPTPVHPCTTRILKSIDFNEISIPVSELLLCFVWVHQRDKSQGWDETSILSTLSRPLWRPGSRKAKGYDGQDQRPGTWQGVG